MIKLLFATHNAHKVAELRAILATLSADSEETYEVLSFDDIPGIPDVDETGTTFAENAYLKAQACANMGYITIADDSGLTVDALGGAPGIYSARYSGTHGDDRANNEKLLHEMVGVEDRTAAYVCAIACVFPSGAHFTVQGICRGEIVEMPRGAGGFGYDPLFLIPEENLTFAELSAEEKNKRSHRTAALKRFAEEFPKYRR